MISIPIYLDLDEVINLLPADWSRRKRTRALQSMGVLRNLGSRRMVVVTSLLQTQLPEVFDAVIERRVSTSSVDTVAS